VLSTILSIIATAVAAFSLIITYREKNQRRQEKRLKDLEAGLAATKIVQGIDAEKFDERLNSPAGLPANEIAAIECLQSLEKYFNDQTAREDIDILCRALDQTRQGKKTGGNYPYIKTLQDRLPKFVDKVRHVRIVGRP